MWNLTFRFIYLLSVRSKIKNRFPPKNRLPRLSMRDVLAHDLSLLIQHQNKTVPATKASEYLLLPTCIAIVWRSEEKIDDPTIFSTQNVDTSKKIDRSFCVKQTILCKRIMLFSPNIRRTSTGHAVQILTQYCWIDFQTSCTEVNADTRKGRIG